ncbi:uncharacterized protein LOC131018915 [Salvia miltiorrhiza]|uniref:uncharacterized protein LOC131018915 n=1 Tax=Salvia miltiorrhiza TaxID=226208 RepID=UPI0025AC4984|nr:uncharacterized protein LOC131018915 [Salvia miltiorrhiza]
MQKNLVHYGKHLVAIFKSVAYAYRSEEFHRNFTALQVLKPTAHRHLFDVGEHRWARSKCLVRPSSFMTSNAAESLNSHLLWARCLPICSLLECYRSIVEKWFDERHVSVIGISHQLTEKTALKLQVAVETGCHLIVCGTTTHMFTVEQENKSYVVDLQNLTCECKEFELDGIPCRHVCAAIRRVGLQVTDFVAKYFHQSSLMGTYLPHIRIVPHTLFDRPISWDGK